MGQEMRTLIGTSIGVGRDTLARFGRARRRTLSAALAGVLVVASLSAASPSPRQVIEFPTATVTYVGESDTLTLIPDGVGPLSGYPGQLEVVLESSGGLMEIPAALAEQVVAPHSDPIADLMTARDVHRFVATRDVTNAIIAGLVLSDLPVPSSDPEVRACATVTVTVEQHSLGDEMGEQVAPDEVSTQDETESAPSSDEQSGADGSNEGEDAPEDGATDEVTEDVVTEDDGGSAPATEGSDDGSEGAEEQEASAPAIEPTSTNRGGGGGGGNSGGGGGGNSGGGGSSGGDPVEEPADDAPVDEDEVQSSNSGNSGGGNSGGGNSGGGNSGGGNSGGGNSGGGNENTNSRPGTGEGNVLQGGTFTIVRCDEPSTLAGLDPDPDPETEPEEDPTGPVTGEPGKIVDLGQAYVGLPVLQTVGLQLATATSNVWVEFTVTSGGGSLQGARVQTDASGVATLGAWILGDVLGIQRLVATVTNADGDIEFLEFKIDAIPVPELSELSARSRTTDDIFASVRGTVDGVEPAYDADPELLDGFRLLVTTGGDGVCDLAPKPWPASFRGLQRLALNGQVGTCEVTISVVVAGSDPVVIVGASRTVSFDVTQAVDDVLPIPVDPVTGAPTTSPHVEPSDMELTEQHQVVPTLQPQGNRTNLAATLFLIEDEDEEQDPVEKELDKVDVFVVAPLIDGGTTLLVDAEEELDVDGEGYEPGSAVAIYMFSTPTLLGMVTVDEDGTFETSLPIPAALQRDARHTLRVVGFSDNGNRWTLSAPVWLASRPVPPPQEVIDPEEEIVPVAVVPVPRPEQPAEEDEVPAEPVRDEPAPQQEETELEAAARLGLDADLLQALRAFVIGDPCEALAVGADGRRAFAPGAANVSTGTTTLALQLLGDECRDGWLTWPRALAVLAGFFFLIAWRRRDDEEEELLEEMDVV